MIGKATSTGHSPRPHQILAVSAVLRALEQADRVQIHMACGSGKTLVGGEVLSARVPRLGIWLSPTLELMAESVGALRHVLPNHRRILVGSGRRHRTEVPMTTDVEKLARNLSGPCLVFSTYTSFPRLVAALEITGRQPDLTVSDEAHRTAGENGKLYSRWLEGRVAGQRLAMTATPRKVLARDGSVTNSMENEALYGEVAFQYPFAQAIAEGVICDIQAVIPVVDGVTGIEAQVEAIRQSQRQFGLKRLLSFHSSIREAKALTDALLASGIAALHVNGRSSAAQLKAAKDALRSAESIVVTNARVFGEGVDVPALDAVFFADFKGSSTDIAQQIGRAVRRQPGKLLGHVILPPTNSTDLGETLRRGRYGRLWRLVSGILDLTENPDVRKVGDGPQIRFTTTNGSAAVDNLLQQGLSRLLYLRRFKVSERAWQNRAEEVLSYVLAGNAPYADASPHKVWISDNGISYRAGRLSEYQSSFYARIQAAIDAPRLERLEKARQYVASLEAGGPPDYALTCLVRDNRRTEGYAPLYRRMLAVRRDKVLARQSRLLSFVEAYERGEITSRSIYAQMISGIDDALLSERFATAHRERLGRIERRRQERQKAAVQRFRSGEPAKQVADALGVTPSTIWYWDRQTPRDDGPTEQ